jgi:hypothetical protein
MKTKKEEMNNQKATTHEKERRDEQSNRYKEEMNNQTGTKKR